MNTPIPFPSFFPLMGGLREASLLLCLFLSFASCTNEPDPRPATIHVRVTGECVCNVFIYTTGGICLQSKVWDCQETTVLAFNLYLEDTLIVKAEYRDKTASETIRTQFGHTHELGIVF